MRVFRTAFANFALTRIDNPSSNLIHLYSGISYQARRPFASQKYAFTISAQWVARSVFADSLANPRLRSISPEMAVLYTPKARPIPELEDFHSQYLGHVKQIGHATDAVVDCRDGETRSIPLSDLTLEASPEAIRRYERENGTTQQAIMTWRDRKSVV